MSLLYIKALLVAAAVFYTAHAQLPSAEQRASDLQAAIPEALSAFPARSGSSVASQVVALQDEILAAGGCNANICFGLDGSNLISDLDYERQRQFVQIVAATVAIDESVKMSVYQYGLRLRQISEFTSDINSLLLKLEDATRNPTIDRSFLSPAIFQCQRDFKANVEDANKIAIIGDGNTNYGSQSQAVRVASMFLPPNKNGAICAVYVKEPNFRFFDQITQDPSRVISVDNYFAFTDILDEVVRNVCSLFG